jgi:acylphosphatase
MTRRTLHFSGHVQGIGFRYTTQELAARFAVTGYVRNMPDGRVELVIEGSDDQVDGLVDAIKQRMRQYIRKVDVQIAPATGEFDDFSVRH